MSGTTFGAVLFPVLGAGGLHGGSSGSRHLLDESILRPLPFYFVESESDVVLVTLDL